MRWNYSTVNRNYFADASGIIVFYGANTTRSITILHKHNTKEILKYSCMTAKILSEMRTGFNSRPFKALKTLVLGSNQAYTRLDSRTDISSCWSCCYQATLEAIYMWTNEWLTDMMNSLSMNWIMLWTSLHIHTCIYKYIDRIFRIW